MLRDQSDDAVGARPERRRPVEDETHGVRVEALDLHVVEGAERGRRGGGVGGELPVEDEVVGAERRAVVPGDAALELPDHRSPVAGDAAVLAARDLRREDRLQHAVGVEARERVVEDLRAELVLGAGGEVRVQQRRRLPQQDAQRPAAATLGGLVGRRRRRLRHTGIGEQQPGHRRADAEGGETLHEASSRQRAAAHRLDLTTELAFVHRRPPGWRLPAGRTAPHRRVPGGTHRRDESILGKRPGNASGTNP